MLRNHRNPKERDMSDAKVYVWRASGTENRQGACADNPRWAAVDFFTRYPTARKCDVLEYEVGASGMLKIRFDLTGKGRKPGIHRDVTRKQAITLPEAPSEP